MHSYMPQLFPLPEEQYKIRKIQQHVAKGLTVGYVEKKSYQK